jgi:hypothetical protein
MSLTPDSATYDPARHGERLETVVRYRPYAWPARILFTLLFAGFGLGFIGAAFFFARQVTVDCSHDTATCTITKTYPLLGARREWHDLASVRGTGLWSRRTKNGGMLYAVTLRTDAGEDSISASYAAFYARQGQKRALDAFLADADAPPLHILYDRGSPVGFVMCAFSLVMLWTLWTTWQVATVRFEWWRGAVVLERRRWPLALWSRAFQLAEVTGARVEERGMRRRNTYRVLLALGSGATVPLLTVPGSGYGMHSEVAAELNAAIARRQPAPARY